MEKLEVIRTTHLIDHHLQQLTTALASEALRKKVLALHTEWHELAFAISAHLCAVETSSHLGGSKRNFQKKKRHLGDSTESELEENTAASSSLTQQTTLSTTPEERS